MPRRRKLQMIVLKITKPASATAEPASRTWMLYSTRSVRLPWLEERAARLADVVRRLRARGRDSLGGKDSTA